jgi:hypothetical protein
MPQDELPRDVADEQRAAATRRTQRALHGFGVQPAFRRKAIVRNLVDDRLIV